MENEEPSEFSNLQNNFIKQQAQISALKELVRKTEKANEKTSYTQEKVRNIAQRLTHIKSKVRTRENHDMSCSEADISFEKVEPAEICSANSTADIKINSEKPGSEKFLLLRQQMKQNKLKMAERENTKKEIEEMVVQLKAKMDNTQLSLEKSTELGRSMTELSSFSGAPVTRFKSSADLSFIPLNIDKERIKFLENRIRFLDKQHENEKEDTNKSQFKNQITLLECKILDLEKSLKEKESIIQKYSREGENIEDLLANSIIETSQIQLAEGNDNYLQEIEFLKSEILNLKEINNILEQTRFDLTIKNSKLELEIEDIHSSCTKTEELNKSLQNQIFDLINQKVAISPEHEKQCVKLDEQIVQYRNYNSVQDICSADTSDADKINSLESSLEMERKEIENLISKNQEYKDKLIEKDIEYNVLKANFTVLEEKIKTSPKTLFSKTTDKTAELEINKLKQQLDDSNKSMIKLKLKAKQLQKQIDEFAKMSNVNNELVTLEEENQKLQQQIHNLQDKGQQSQTSLANINDERVIIDDEIYKKVELLEITCCNQTSAIQILQDEKLKTEEKLHQLKNMKNNLYTLLKKLIEISGEKDILPDLESVTLEEIIINCNNDIEKLNCSYNEFKNENLSLQNLLNNSDAEKQSLQKNIEYYINENSELLDKIEKLNKSNSSAESIEIVERLTQQEKDELAQFETPIKFNLNQNNQEYDDQSNTINHDLSESLVKLREESSELMHKIELFTVERKEVLDKMEILSNDNQANIHRIGLLEQENVCLEENVENLKYKNSNLENKIQNISEDNLKLKQDIVDLTNQKDATAMNVVNNSFTQSFIKKCEINLDNLYMHIENYRKVRDKNSKIQASKKLVKETEFIIQEIKKLIQINKLESHQTDDVVELESSKQDLERTEDHESKLTVEKNIQSLAIQDAKSSQLKFDTKIQMLENENEILKTLNEELKQQLIESFNENQLTDNNINQLKIELNNKQETINTLNLQLMDLYDSMEKQTANLLEKEDALIRHREKLDAGVLEINKLQLENNENKAILEKHYLQEKQLQARILELENHNALLETKTVRQLDKLKKFAANIKKKNIDCSNLEEKIKFLEQKHNSDLKLLQTNNDLENKINYYENEIQKINLARIHEIDIISKEKELLENNLSIVKMELDKKKQELEDSQINLQSIKNECDEILNENMIHLQQKISSQDQNIEDNKMYIADLLNEIKMKNIKLDKFQFLINENNIEIERLKSEIENLNIVNNSNSVNNNESIFKYNELQKNYSQLFHIYDKDRQSFRNTLFRLETLDEFLQVKLNEYVRYIEVLESEHKNYKDILFELEDIILSFETRANILNTQFQNKDKRNEIRKETLINRLNMLWESNVSNFEKQHSIVKYNNNQIQASESDTMRTQIKQNLTDDQVFIENENQRLKDNLNKKDSEIELYQRTIFNIQDKCDILTKEITELKIVLNKKDEEINHLGINLNNLNKKNILLAKNESNLEEDNSFSHRSAQSEEGILSSFFALTPTAKTSFLDDKANNDKSKIADLQQNVSDLEKYVMDLESKIRHLTKINEETSLLMDNNTSHHNIVMKEYEDQIKTLESKLKVALSKNIANVITVDNSIYDNTDSDIIEPIIVPKKAYLCGPEVVADQNASLTNESLSTTAGIASESNRIEYFVNKIEELELEQKRLQEEKQALQIKSGKMMRKLKEYKVKVDQQNQIINTRKATSMGSVDLDLTIQEEMRNEILRLEKNTTEIMKNLENEKIEKNLLLKRNNTLVSNNERMVEIKEHQDIEINNLQRHIRELNLKTMPVMDSQPEQVEIKYNINDSFGKEDNSLNQEMYSKDYVKELQATLDKEIDIKCSLENQLECLQNEINILENDKSSVDEEDSIQLSNTEMLNIKLENHKLQSQLSEYESTIKQLENNSVNIIKKVDNLTEELQNKLSENLKLNMDLQIATKTNNSVPDTQLNREVENSVFSHEQNLYENKISELMSQLQYLTIEKAQLKDQVEELEKTNQTKDETFERYVLENEVTKRDPFIQPMHDQNISDSNISEFTLEKEISEPVLLCIREIENGSISQECINLLQNKLDKLQSKHTKEESLNVEVKNEEENSNIIKNMTKMLENQKLVIVTLQDQLSLKSAQRDPYAQISESSSLSNTKSELDLTLYMLHQRDMRCEELQLELINLLAERDTLQLKLSNAIRQNEHFKHKFVQFSEDNQLLHDNTIDIDLPFSSSSVSLQDQKYEVNTKMSRLYSVSNTKDENILESRERKQETMQQDVANIPTEAITELVGVDMTNSTQSASTLLLNWLWGKTQSHTS